MFGIRGCKLLTALVVGFLLWFGLTPVGAASANISHSYHSTDSITNGSLVSLDSAHTDYVIAANSNNGKRLVGVAVASNESLLAVDPTSGSIQVAISGEATTLVSTLNGEIKVGDQIAVSPFNGVGMKASPGSSIIGLSQGDFNNQSSGATPQNVVDKNGHSQQIQVGYVQVSLSVGTAASSSQADLNGVQRLARNLTGHAVSTPRIVLSLVVALTSLLALITLVYASIYASIISIGRNPLARYAVFRTLGSVLGMAALIAGVAAVIIFFLLR